ncbi:hypothetical protein LEP1GSC061_1401 [Leptospira wolffii serovar Khorat str. Khorat-H2]|nr:hypothetical protein LEP1GSC061_1401 [Leptospira wolffii serovar Khorat str. Khorat-H2]
MVREGERYFHLVSCFSFTVDSLFHLPKAGESTQKTGLGF